MHIRARAFTHRALGFSALALRDAPNLSTMQPSPPPFPNYTNPYLDALERIVFNIAVGLVGDAAAFTASRGPHDGLGVLVVLKRLGQLRVLGQGLFLHHACVLESEEGGDGGCGGLVGPLGREQCGFPRALSALCVCGGKGK